MDKTGEEQISLTDPDARAMARMTKVGVGYNVQLAVDVKHKLIAEQEVCNQVLDMGLLAPTVEAAMDTPGVEKIDAVADRRYFKIEDIEACETAGITAYVPKPIRRPAVAQGFFSKEEFSYDAEADVYTCPADQVLRPRYYGKSRDNVKVIYCDRKVSWRVQFDGARLEHQKGHHPGRRAGPNRHHESMTDQNPPSERTKAG